ncbi:MAG TPA: hypothetical protein VKV73_30295 [Chloroflexota bacterium]|nr:hypothetical protein [Chloroflexota bacterium]
MWLDSENWTTVTRTSLAADARALRTELREWANTTDQLVASVRNYSESDPDRRLDEAQLSAMENTARLRDQLVLVAVYAVLARYPTLGEELAQLAPGSANDVMRWYRLTFSANGAQHAVFVTRNLPAPHIAALAKVRTARTSTLTCISYETPDPKRSRSVSTMRRLRAIFEQDWIRDAKVLEETLHTTLSELGASVEQAAPQPARARPGVARGARAEAPPPRAAEPTPPAVVSEAPAPAAPPPASAPAPEVATVYATGADPFGQWDGFVFPVRMTHAELEKDLDIEFQATRADPLRLGEKLTRAWHDSSNEARATLATALETGYDTDLLVTFARAADHIVGDDRLAEQLYRRAVRGATPNHPAHWFLMRYLLRHGRSGQAMDLAKDSSDSLAGFLRQAVIEYETSNQTRLPDLHRFEAAIRAYSPQTGRSLADAATLWYAINPEALPGQPSDALLWALGHAREFEHAGNPTAAAEQYLAVLEALVPTRNVIQEALTPNADLRGQATPVIGALRGLGRVEPQTNLRDRWRRCYSRLAGDDDFRKQYLLFLQGTGDPSDVSEAQRLRTEFEARRASGATAA